MKYYLDITLLPDAEANLGFIWQKVYQQVHLALVENQTPDGGSAVAVCVPEYNDKTFPLGSKLRLFASQKEHLQKIDMGKWLSRLADYTHCTSIKEVPSSVKQYVRFKRVQYDTNIERLARRRAKRKGESFDEALQHYSGFKDQQSKLPFVNMSSLSSGAKFRLFIEKEMFEEAKAGEFSCYGLSMSNSGSQATVPWF